MQTQSPRSWTPPAIRQELHFGRLVPCFVERPRTLSELIAHTVSKYPNAEAVVDSARRLTYGELHQGALHVAAGLAADGITAGDRVVFFITNRHEFMVALVACVCLGAIAVPVNVREERDGLIFVLNQCQAKAIIFDAALVARLPEQGAVATALRMYAIGGPVNGATAFESLGLNVPPLADVAQPNEDDTAVLLYTSGTTGRPKGAMLTHINIIHSVIHYRICMGIRAGDRSLLAVPASHVTGLVAITLSMFLVGGCVMVMHEFKAGPFLEFAAREHMTHTLVVPAIYNLLLRDPNFDRTDLLRWRIGGYGGAPMPEPTIQALAKKLPNLVLQNAYGATETTSPVTVIPTGKQTAHLASVGQVVPCGDVRIMDDDGREVPVGEPGELWIGGPMIVPGYWDNPAATEREFASGYWKSGDIGSIDAEGYVYVFDRKKDMINRAGYKVYCAEVESVLSAHPDVVEVALVAQPDPVLGEKSRAFVVARSAALSTEAVRAYCALHLADYKVPDFVTFLDSPLPRNANGKILKRQLRS
jgi:long-chain acyl-CoA synthetase